MQREGTKLAQFNIEKDTLTVPVSKIKGQCADNTLSTLIFPNRQRGDTDCTPSVILYIQRTFQINILPFSISWFLKCRKFVKIKKAHLVRKQVWKKIASKLCIWYYQVWLALASTWSSTCEFWSIRSYPLFVQGGSNSMPIKQSAQIFIALIWVPDHVSTLSYHHRE